MNRVWDNMPRCLDESGIAGYSHWDDHEHNYGFIDNDYYGYSSSEDYDDDDDYDYNQKEKEKNKGRNKGKKPGKGGEDKSQPGGGTGNDTSAGSGKVQKRSDDYDYKGDYHQDYRRHETDSGQSYADKKVEAIKCAYRNRDGWVEPDYTGEYGKNNNYGDYQGGDYTRSDKSLAIRVGVNWGLAVPASLAAALISASK